MCWHERAAAAALSAGLLLIPSNAPAFEREDCEESAGSTFSVLLNPQDDIYGIGFGEGTWIRNTPVFGDYFLRVFDNGVEDAWYSGVGMTIRIMPHWAFAPFVGAGGSYNYSMSGAEEEENTGEENLPDRGDHYWGGHVEAGFRLLLNNRIGLLEFLGRYTWSSLDGDRDYWLIGVSTRPGW